MAKLASKRNKPRGVCFLFEDAEIKNVLKTTKVEDVWGVGYATQKRLHAMKINTAYKFANSNFQAVRSGSILDSLHVPHFKTQQELLGIKHFEVSINNLMQKSIQSTRSFINKTNNR